MLGWHPGPFYSNILSSLSTRTHHPHTHHPHTHHPYTHHPHSQRTPEGVVTGGGTGMIVHQETGDEEEEREAPLHMEGMGMMETATMRGEGEG